MLELAQALQRRRVRDRVDGALELTQRTDGDATEIQLCHATPHDLCF